MNRIYVIEIMKCVQGKIPCIREVDLWNMAGRPHILRGDHREFTDSMDSNSNFEGLYRPPTARAGWNVWTYVGGTSNDK